MATPRAKQRATILTGAAGGIGRDVAAALSAAGDRLLLADIDLSGARRLAARLRKGGRDVAAIGVDIADPESARAMAAAALDRFGRIDALVHAAGIDAPKGKAWLLGDDHWRKVIDVDLSGAWWCAKAVLPAMLRQRAGRIVLIGSSSGRTHNIAVSAAYNAAKSGINGLAIGLSAQVEAKGVRVNVVAPGPTGTGNAFTPAERRAYRRTHPLGEGGTRPVVEACLYLLGPGGDWMSGSVVNVSGGRLRG
ncbi:MAG: SDR family oxidoreductase [Alphaproteobacteria bacterium]|nr:SDR family oxidoreductase [Alphaproteobacteria bacterium]